MPVLQTGLAKSAAADYTIDQSLRFEDGDSAYLSRTAGSTASSSTAWTYSGWVKLGVTSYGYVLFMGGPSVNDYSMVGTTGAWPDTQLYIVSHTDPSTDSYKLKTSQLLRDYAGWYHIFVAYDSTQAETDRIKVYINGERVTAFSTATYPSASLAEPYINVNTKNQMLSRWGTDNDTGYFGGYMAEVHVIDGTASVGDFGETDAATGQWKAIEYTGTYPGNSFYLKFESGAIGTDSSPNGNTFTATNLSSTTDVVLDSPSNNWCTLNPLFKYWGGGSVIDVMTFSEGNLKADASGSYGFATGTIAPSSGKWYYEIAGITDAQTTIGAYDMDVLPTSADNFYELKNYRYYGYTGIAYDKDGSTVATYSTFGIGDVIGCALDLDNNKIFFSKNGVWQGSSDPAAGTNPLATDVTGAWVPACSADTSQSVKINFGQDSSFSGSETAQGNGPDGTDFYYEPPAGYLALCSSNLASPAIADPTKYFSATEYSGNAGEHVITTGVEPDLIWFKRTDASQNHALMDGVRGWDKVMYPNLTNAEGTETSSITIQSDGFTIPDSSYGGAYNNSGSDYVVWNWKAGSSASGTTGGSGTSKSYTAKYSADAGISIIGYEGNGAAGHEIPHHLSVAPELVICKERETAGFDWLCYAEPVGATKNIRLNLTNAAATATGFWNDTAPSASVFTVGNNGDVNFSGKDIIALCFHSIPGYSAIGSFVGNGDSSDGSFVHTGFSPAWVMFKNIDNAYSWVMYDNKRDTYNVKGDSLYADDSAAETDDTQNLDFVSNGFKFRDASYQNNYDSNTYIYLAIAESPFQYSNAR